MARIAIGYRDRVAGSALTAGSALVTLPAANLGTAQLRKVWRSGPGVTSTYILADLGAAVAIGGVALMGCNLTAVATWRVRLSTADATGAAGDAHDSTTIGAGVDPDYRMAVLLLAAAATGRYLRVDLTDASLSYLEAGVLWAGTVWKPERNYRFGAQLPYRDHSKRFPGDDGQVWILRGSLQRGVAFTLPAVLHSERDADGLAMLRHNGLHRDVLVVTDPDASNLGRASVYGLLDELPAYENTSPDRNSASFRVMERL